VLLYFGGLNMDLIPDVITYGDFGGEHYGDRYGCSISYGDINNDGFDDLLVGAKGLHDLDEHGGDRGRCYVYFGNSFYDNNPNLVLVGEGVDTYFGSFVNGHGDINNDGNNDILIGTDTFLDTSKVYLYDYTVEIPSYTINISPDSLTIGSEMNSCGELKIYTNTTWESATKYYSHWIKVDPPSGEGNSELVVTADSENPSATEERDYQLILSIYNRGWFKSLKIKQLTEPGYFSASTDEIVIESLIGSIAEFEVESNISWRTYEYADWLRVDPEFGDGDGNIILTALSSNSSSEEIRSDTIYIKAGGIIQKVLVSQNTLVGLDSDNNKVIEEYSLSQNYPNPFNPSTAIKYSIPNQSQVSIKVFDVLGSEVTTLVNKEQSQGSYEVEFDPSAYGLRLTSGLYFYRFQAGGYVQTKKMILLN
jgi:hypothetical protein